MASERTGATLIEAVEEENEIVDALRSRGLDELAARLADPKAMLTEDP